MISVFQPSLGSEELEAVDKVFRSNWVGKGSITDRFEAGFAAHLGVEEHLVQSVSCCTEGLFQSMDLLALGPGDQVIVPTIGFVGAANAVVASGATPIFCDVDPRSLNPTVKHIEEQLTPRTKAAILMHYAGVPCLMDDIVALAEQKGIAIVEDCACSVWSRWRGQACGTLGDIGVWSFDAMKILVTGDGGMVYTRNGDMSERLRRLLYLGLSRESGFSNRSQERWWEFEVAECGRRAIMNDISAAIGIEQLRKLPTFISRRREICDGYSRALAGEEWLTLPAPLPAHARSSYYYYPVQLQAALRDRLAVHLRDRGVYTTFRYYPLHWLGFYGADVSLPNAEQAARTTLCLPIHQALTDEQLATVVSCVQDFGKNL